MTDEPITLTSADIARMADVRPSAVSNWRNRPNKHFPKPVKFRNGRPLFDYGEVTAWLDDNGIKFKETEKEQEAWSFFERWRGQMDPVTMSSLLLWALTLDSCSERFGLKTEWDSLCADEDDPATRSDELVTLILQKTNGTSDDDVLQSALSAPEIIQQLSSKDVNKLIQFANKLLNDKTADASYLASMILERSIIATGRTSGEAGCPNAPVSALLAKLAASYLDSRKVSSTSAISVYDPACGIAESIIQFMHIMQNFGNGETRFSLHCADINLDMIATAARRLVLMDSDNASILIHGNDSLQRDAFPGLRADIVMMEPPFGMRRQFDAPDSRWRYGTPYKLDSALSWVQDAIAHLSDEGRAFVVTSEGPLFRTNAEASIRRALVAAGCVEAIISLPGKLYANTAIPTAIWVLSTPDPSRDSIAMISTTAEWNDHRGDDNPPAWMRSVLDDFSHGAAQTRFVRTVDILGKDSASLFPADWMEHDIPNAGEIASEYNTHNNELKSLRLAAAEAIHAIDDFDVQGFNCSPTNTVRLGDIATIRKGNAAPSSQTPSRRNVTASEQNSVTLQDIHNHTFRPLTSAEADDEDETVTEPGDLLVATVNTISAMVDMTGGHRISSNVSIARLKSRNWNPEYVALMIEGDWNNLLMRGSTIRRAHPAQLEIPAIPLDQQNRMAAYGRAVMALQHQADTYRRQLNTVANAARYGARLGTVRKDSTENGE